MSADNTQQKSIFNHRFDMTEARDTGAVIDAIGLMTDKAKSILYLLSGNFDGESRYNDKIVQSAIHTAIAEIDDIDEVLRAHCEAYIQSRSEGTRNE